MGFTIKGLFAVVCAVGGLVTAAFALFHGHYWSAAGLVVAGLMTGANFLLGFNSVQNSLLGLLGTVLFTAAGWAAVMTESPGFDIEGQTVEVAVAMDLLTADAISHRNWGSPELQQAANRAAKICMLQGGALDQMDATVAGMKTVYYGPGATLADATIDLAQRKTETPDCLATFRQLYAADPTVFPDISTEHKAWLRAHDIGT